MASFKVGKYNVNIGKTAGGLLMAFFVGWLCGCSESKQVGIVLSGKMKYPVVCLQETQYYKKNHGRGGILAPVIIKGEYQTCKK